MRHTELMVTTIICLAVIVGLFFLASSDAADQRAEHAQRCTMWAVWHEGGARGVPVEKRYGWPDTAGRYFAECEQ